MKRNEYLNQTFNFLPEIVKEYDDVAKNDDFEFTQRQIIQYQGKDLPDEGALKSGVAIEGTI